MRNYTKRLPFDNAAMKNLHSELLSEVEAQYSRMVQINPKYLYNQTL